MDGMKHGDHNNHGNMMDHHGNMMDHHGNMMDHQDNMMDHQGNHNTYHVAQEPHGGAHHHGHGGHHASFFNTQLNATVLFQNWILESRANVFIACLVAVVLALGYQATKWLRQYLHNHYRDKKHSIKSKEHLLQTCLYVSELLVSYLLMLMVMTYNVWMFVATILSLTIGYFVIGLHKKRPQPCPERCQADCPNLPENQKIDLANYAEASEQELMPLENRRELCQGCSYGNYDLDDVKETDILT